MTLRSYFRPHDLAQTAHISVQQVRNYEANGFIPPAERSPSGYRRYTAQHLAALKMVRLLIAGYGRQYTQQIMQAIHAHRREVALALIDTHHAQLAATRTQLEQTLAALRPLTTHLPGKSLLRRADRVRVSAAAQMVGVRVSSLRFWERLGLLAPEREANSRYRVYGEAQLRRLRIVALLRQTHHDFATIRTTLNELEAGQPERAIATVEQRRTALSEQSWQCIQALAALYDYVNTYLPALAERESC